MGSSARKQRQKEHLSKSIIQIAMGILQSEGLESVTIRAIADKMEYSAPIVYSFFESKDALLDKLSERGYQKLVSKIKEAQPDTQDAFQRLQSVCSGYESFALENHSLYLLMSNQFLKNRGNLKAMPYSHNLSELFKSAIRQLIPESPEAVDNAYRGMIALMHGVVCLSLGNVDYSLKDRMATISNFIRSVISESNKSNNDGKNGNDIQ